MEPQEPHGIAIINMMAGSLEERQQRRLYVAVGLAEILEHIIRRGLIHKLAPVEDALQWERVQRAHIKRYMRTPQNPLMSDIERQTGGRIDRVSLALCDAIRAWDQLVKARNSKHYRKMQAVEQETKRQTKLLQRRIRDAEKMIAAKPRPKTTRKQVEHEEVERCAKCHKRPAAKSGLCEPCFQWEHAKLGRE